MCFFYFIFLKKTVFLFFFTVIQPYAHFTIYNKQRIIFSLAVQFHFNTGVIFILANFQFEYAFGESVSVYVYVVVAVFFFGALKLHIKRINLVEESK